MKCFSDFAAPEELSFDGEKVRIDSLLNKPIILKKFKVRPSKYKDRSDRCATVQFSESENSSDKIFFTGSNVIIDTLEKYKDELPFMTTIKKIERFYTLS